MKNRPQKNAKTRPAELAGVPPIAPAQRKWLDGQALFSVSLIAFIGLTSMLFPLNFYLFAVNSQSSLSIPVQALWTVAAIGAVVLIARKAIPRIPGVALFVVASASIFSFCGVSMSRKYPLLVGVVANNLSVKRWAGSDGLFHEAVEQQAT